MPAERSLPDSTSVLTSLMTRFRVLDSACRANVFNASDMESPAWIITFRFSVKNTLCARGTPVFLSSQLSSRCSRVAMLVFGYAEDFLDGGDGVDGLNEAVFDQRDHPFFDSQFFDFIGIPLAVHEGGDFRAHFQNFVDADAALVAFFAALRTAGTAPEGSVFDFLVFGHGADPS